MLNVSVIYPILAVFNPKIFKLMEATHLIRFEQILFVECFCRITRTLVVIHFHAQGYLFYNKTFYQDTVLSRIRRLWSDIRASRAAFDATPSKGMLDKAAARPLHRIWSYVFRGFLTSILLLIFWPPVCLVVSILSLLAGLTLPVVVPFVSLISHLLGLLFWDAYKPGK